MPSSTIAFVGLGAMGAGSSVQLVQKGFTVAGYDLRAQAVESFVSACASSTSGGGKVQGAASAREAAQDKDILFVMTLNDDQARAILFGSGADAKGAGALEVLAREAVVVVLATVSPAAAEALARDVKAARPDVDFVDAPVSGGTPGAQTGALTIMASGSDSAFEKVKPALDAMGSKVYHVGTRPGQGESMKAINQILCGVHLVAAAEAISMAKATGIDPALALQIVQSSAAGSWMLSNRAPRMLETDPQCFSSVNLWSKDLSIVLDAGRSAGAHLPLSATAAQMWNSAVGRGLGTQDDTTVIRLYDWMNGNDRRRGGNDS